MANFVVYILIGTFCFTGKNFLLISLSQLYGFDQQLMQFLNPLTKFSECTLIVPQLLLKVPQFQLVVFCVILFQRNGLHSREPIQISLLNFVENLLIYFICYTLMHLAT